MHPNDTTNETSVKLCECGCGLPTNTRFVKGHHNKLRVRFNNTPSERFWSKVDKRSPDECWEWQGSVSRGYGRFSVDRTEFKAHRYSYVLYYGPIPDGYQVCHGCDNPRCVNPAHLWIGTGADNMHDRDAKGRGARLVGEASPCAILTENDVREIRRRVSDGERRAALADEYQVHTNTIIAIVARQNWRHVS